MKEFLIHFKAQFNIYLFLEASLFLITVVSSASSTHITKSRNDNTVSSCILIQLGVSSKVLC